MRTKEAVANRITQLCTEKSMTINGLARISGVAPSTLKNIIGEGSQNPGVVTIKKLCDGFDITLSEFFSTKDFDGLEQEIK